MLQGLFLKSLLAFMAATGSGLGAPQATAIPGESQVLINWSPPSGAINGIQIEDSLDSGNTWTTVTKLPPNSTHIRVQGLTDGKNYWFRVRWIWPDNSLGIPSRTLVAIPINNPSQPTGLIATASGTQVALNWDQTTEKSVTGYGIEQSTDGGTTWTVVSANTGSSSSGYLIDNLTRGSTYTFRIRALAFGGGRSDYSEVTSVKVGLTPTGGFALTYKITGTKINLTWETPQDIPDVTTYQVNASGDGGANWFTVATTQGGINTALVPYVIGGSTYQVIATSAAGETSASSIELVETNLLPDPVTTATFNPGATGESSSPAPSDSASPTPTPTDSTSAPVTKSSSLPIIPIAGALVLIALVSWLTIGMRNRDGKKGARKRPRPKKKPAKKKKSSVSPTRTSTQTSQPSSEESKKKKKKK